MAWGNADLIHLPCNSIQTRWVWNSKFEGMTHQPSFSQAEFANKKKITRREKFLARMEAVIPWARLLAVLEPFYPQGERGGTEKEKWIHFLYYSI